MRTKKSIFIFLKFNALLLFSFWETAFLISYQNQTSWTNKNDFINLSLIGMNTFGLKYKLKKQRYDKLLLEF